jgi:hypothetical protein
MDSTGSRYWFRVDKPELVKGFGNRLKLKAAEIGLGFMKLDKNGKGVLWTICDTSVFSPERLTYDGQPRIQNHERLSLGAPDITVNKGGIVEIDIFPNITSEAKRKIKKDFNVEVTSRGGILAMSNNTYLELDTRVEIMGKGTKTVLDFWRSGQERWRCQSTFRDSESWNGALKIDACGLPYLHDFGGETTYHLSDDSKGALLFGEYANEI